MKLIPNWDQVLTRAWSVRIASIIAVGDIICQTVLNLNVPWWIMVPALGFLIWARVTKQPGLSDGQA